MNFTPEMIADNVGEIASLPTIYLRLQELISDVRTSHRDIADLLSDDTGVSVRLLRISNSAFYGFPASIDTITRAITVIGTRQLSDIVLATSVIDMFNGIDHELVNIESFWRHSIATGTVARILANFRRETNIEKYFVSGMLHDIGRLAMFMVVPKESQLALTRAYEEQRMLEEVEREIFGFDHADVGGVLLKKWKLPKNLVDAAHYHHQPGKATEQDTIVIHVAEVIASAMQLGSAGDFFVPPLDKNAWQDMALPVSVLSPVIEQTKKQYQAVVELIFIQSGNGIQK